jgi:hypothetical protein
MASLGWKGLKSVLIEASVLHAGLQPQNGQNSGRSHNQVRSSHIFIQQFHFKNIILEACWSSLQLLHCKSNPFHIFTTYFSPLHFNIRLPSMHDGPGGLIKQGLSMICKQILLHKPIITTTLI